MTSELGALGRPRPRLTAVFARYRYALAALDQMALSVFGFALNICLLRTLSATDYGIVSLWMTMALFGVSVQSALVLGPLNIYLPGAAEPQAARRLETALATMNLVAVLAAAALAGAVNFFADAEWASHDALTVIAIPLFVAAGMYREYYRSTAFSRRDMSMLLWVDGPYLAITAACLVAMVLWPQLFADLAAAFLAMTVGCLVSQLCVRARGDGAERRLFRRGWFKSYRGISGEVSWSLLGVFANHIQSRSYVYIATSLAGLASLAAINAVGVLFRPVSVLVNAWGQSALPHLSAALAAGRIAEFDRTLGRALAGSAVASVAIGAVLWLAWNPIEHYLFAGKYGDGIALLLPWAAASGASVLRYVGSTGLMAAREFKFLAKAQIVCGALAAAVTAGFILWDGVSGAMWGIAIGNAACFGWEMARLQRVRRRAAAMAAPLPKPNDQGEADAGAAE
jgi:O-antigen/teichoic acid export membrane protein